MEAKLGIVVLKSRTVEPSECVRIIQCYSILSNNIVLSQVDCSFGILSSSVC